MKLKTIEASYSEGFDRKRSKDWNSAGLSFHRTVKLTAALDKGDNEDECLTALEDRARERVRRGLAQDYKELAEADRKREAEMTTKELPG